MSDEKEKSTDKPIPENYFPEPFEPGSRSPEERIHFLEAKVTLLLDETSELRRLLRLVLEDNPKFQSQTKTSQESFDFQWMNLPEGKSMLSDESWKSSVAQTISGFSGLPIEWFKGKKVMDAACGLGRWTYGFGKLDVETCYSFDISEQACKKTQESTSAFGERFKVFQKDLRQPLGFPNDFDLVWCFGALHHTGASYSSFLNLVTHVKPGGYLFLMMYGEPRPADIGDYMYYNEIFDMRCRLRHFPFARKVEFLEKIYGKEHLHGYFDAISPEINDRYRWDEIVDWFKNAGFINIKRTLPDHPNHHVVAQKANLKT